MYFLKALLMMVILTVGVNAEDVIPKILEKKAIEVMNTFIKILQNNSYEKSAKMVVPLIHKSLLSRDQESLDG